MHELGIISEVVKVARRTAETNNLTKIHKIVLQVGELSGAIPEYVQKAFPAVVYNTAMEDCELEVEEVPAIANCKECNHEYRLKGSDGKCPFCNSNRYDIISGNQLLIKNIVAS